MKALEPWISIPYPLPARLAPAHHHPDCGAPATGGAGVDDPVNANRTRLICVPSCLVITAWVESVNVILKFPGDVGVLVALYAPSSVCPPVAFNHVLLYDDPLIGPVDTSHVAFPLASYRKPPT